MKTVAIIGGGPTRKQAPWTDPTVDIWVMNEAGSLLPDQRKTAVFQMHQPGVYKGQNKNDPRHYEWLKTHHGELAIYMQDADPEVPNAKKYPLEEAKKLTEKVLQKGKNDRTLNPIELFTFTGTYMVALAILMKYDRIRIYGIDLIHTEEYRYQRESFAFWVGFAGGRGIDIEIFGGDSVFKRPLYGYQTFTEFKQMELSLSERILLHDMVLPKEGDMVTMRVVRDFKHVLEFSEEENGLYEIRAIPPHSNDPVTNEKNESDFLQYRWNIAGSEYQKDFEIGEFTRKVVQESFKAFDKNGKFSEVLLDLYDKFGYE